MPVFPAFAESSPEIEILDTVVVKSSSVSETFQTGDVDLDQTPGFYSVIRRDAFEGKTENLAEVIRKEAGVQILQFGGPGSYSTASLRGSSAEQVMVYMDGVLLNEASGGGVDLSNISLSDVESVEIFRGMTPGNFSRASIGGVINIKTVRASEGVSGNVSAGYGSFNTQKYSGLVNGKKGRWDLLVSADWFSSDNDYEILNNNGTEWNPDDDRVENLVNAEFDQQNVFARAGFDLSEDRRVSITNQWYSKDQGLPSWNNAPDNTASFETTRNISTIKFIADNLGSMNLNTSTQLNYAAKKETYDDSGGHIGLGSQHNRYDTEKYGGSFFAEWLTAANTLSLLADAGHETFDQDLSSGGTRQEDEGESVRDMVSVSLQDSLYLFGDKMIVTPAARYTSVRDKLKNGSDEPGDLSEERSRNDSYIKPQLGMKYRLADGIVLKANGGQYVREPSFFELFGDRGLFMANPGLESEKGTNVDVGFEINWDVPLDSMDRISFETAFFYNDADDRIVRTYDARGIGKSENIAESTIKGVEASASLDFNEFLYLSVNATVQDTNIKNSKYDHMNNKQIPGCFEKQFFAKAEIRHKGAKLYSEYIVAQDMYYDSANLLEAGDKYELNAGISYLYRSVTARFDVRNILDNQYEDYRGYYLPGISCSASVKYSF